MNPHAIRAERRAAWLRVVVMLKSVDPALVQTCYRLGANSVVRKPQDLEGMVDLARVLLKCRLRMNEPLRR